MFKNKLTPQNAEGQGNWEEQQDDEGGHDEHHGQEKEALIRKYPEKKVLTRRQINKALMDMEDLAPLKELVGPSHISPILEYVPCFNKRKRGFRFALRECICQELDVVIPESEKGILEDPYLMGGYGVNAYFNILDNLSRMFWFITLVCLPLYAIYGSGVGLKGWKSFPVMRFTLGNLGGSSTACKQQNLAKGDIRLFCPPNSLIDTTDANFGIISNQFESHEYCHQDEIDRMLKIHKHANCSSVVRRDILKKELANNCHKKQKCTIDTKKILDLEKMFGTSEDLELRKQCDDDAYLFVQTPCLVPASQQTTRKLIGLFIGCLGVFIYLFVQVYAQWVKSVESNKYIDWDVATITAADYTVEFEIDPEMFANFQSNFMDQTSPLSEISQFKLYLKDEMEHRLTQFPGLGYDGEEGDQMPVKIAMITFAYANAKVIQHLIARGAAIKSESYATIDKINNDVVESLAHDQELLDQMQTPCSVFISFETEEGFNRCLIYNETVEIPEFQQYKELLGHEIEIGEASEPTDILWENRMYTPFERWYKKCIVFAIILVMLYFSFQTIFYLKKKEVAMKGRYPPHSCDDYNEQYKGRLNSWMTDAIHEFITNHKLLETADEGIFFTGPMQCFCKYQKSQGVKSSNVYSITEKGKTIELAVCQEFFKDMLMGKILGQSISFVIIAINIILKFTILYMVIAIGEETASQQKATVTRGVFLAQFANTGFVILLVNANLTEHVPHEITKHFKGPFYDYMPMWFIDVGLKIQLAMFINMIMPLIGIVITFTVPLIKRKIDNKNTDDPYVTRSTTLQWYKFFNGPGEYMIHFKYSDALNVCFVCLLYGLAIPLLFPIAAITLKLQQFGEKIAVAWVARLPPAMDNSLNNNALNMVSFAPLFLLMNGFWFVDNKTIFSNVWFYRMKITENMKSGHYFNGFVVNQATPLLLFAVFSWVLRIITAIIPEEELARLGFSLNQEDISVDEDLPNFFEALKLKHADLILSEYHNIKNRFGLEIEDAEVIAKLEKVQVPEKSIQGTPWYSVLANLDYCERFVYISPSVKDRKEFIKDANPDNVIQSDFVVLLLNLSAIPDEIVQQFHNGISGPDFQEEFLEAVKRYRKKFERRFGMKWEYQNKTNVKRYLAFKRKRQGQMLNPSYQVGKQYPKLVNLDASYYQSEGNKSRDGSTDAFTGMKPGDGSSMTQMTGLLSPGTAHADLSQRGTLRGALSQNAFASGANPGPSGGSIIDDGAGDTTMNQTVNVNGQQRGARNAQSAIQGLQDANSVIKEE